MGRVETLLALFMWTCRLSHVGLSDVVAYSRCRLLSLPAPTTGRRRGDGPSDRKVSLGFSVSHTQERQSAKLTNRWFLWTSAERGGVWTLAQLWPLALLRFFT